METPMKKLLSIGKNVSCFPARPKPEIMPLAEGGQKGFIAKHLFVLTLKVSHYDASENRRPNQYIGLIGDGPGFTYGLRTSGIKLPIRGLVFQDVISVM